MISRRLLSFSLGLIVRCIFCLGLACPGFWNATQTARAQRSPVAAIVPNQFLVVYRNGAVPANAERRAREAHATLIRRHDRIGVAIFRSDPGAVDAAFAHLRALPEVEAVVHDRVVRVNRLQVDSQSSAYVEKAQPPPPIPSQMVVRLPSPEPPLPIRIQNPIRPIPPGQPRQPNQPSQPILATSPYDTYYSTMPQDWAVQQVGGYGAGVPGAPAHGPWDITMGKGMRIAILDSGVDPNHPDLAPNLVLNLSEIDQSLLPSPCDDGTPLDQQGHGTWTASLAAAALGPGTGLMVGVAPQATLLNIKVLERMPAGDGSNPATQCPGGEPSGLLSWVMAGIEDGVANHADIISMSLGALVDVTTGDGAGLKSAFDQVTSAAAQQGVVLLAAAGNDAVNLSNSQYMELPAQPRDVLAIVASTNPACAQNLLAGASCTPGPVTLAYYSDYGNALAALAAPGGSLPEGSQTGVTGWVRGACSAGRPGTLDGPPADGAHSYGCFNLGHTQYVLAIGTSAATPLAAGAAALLRAANPTWDAATVIAALRSSASTVATLPVSLLNVAPALGVP